MNLKGYITPDNIYYESETRFNSDDLEVPLRQDTSQVWEGNSWASSVRRKDRKQERPQERPQERKQEIDPDYFYIANRAEQSTEKDMKKESVFDSISWKDLLTILYFLAGLAGIWIHTSERIIILEHKLNVAEKEMDSIKANHKEDYAKLESHIKQISTQTTDLLLSIRKN